MDRGSITWTALKFTGDSVGEAAVLPISRRNNVPHDVGTQLSIYGVTTVRSRLRFNPPPKKEGKRARFTAHWVMNINTWRCQTHAVYKRDPASTIRAELSISIAQEAMDDRSLQDSWIWP